MYLDNESGRSMVEMLGVLAVMGILSVAGITGFKIAMDKNRANTIINEAQKRATLVVPQIQLQNNANPTLNEFSNNNLGYATFDGTVYTSSNLSSMPQGQFGIKVSGVSKNICQNILNTLGDNTVIRRLSTTDAPTTALTSCGKTNDFLIIYNNDMTTNPVSGEYTFENCPESFYKCTTTNSCVASENDCPNICGLDEPLSTGCVCPEHRDRTDDKCGDCVDEENYQPWTQPVLTSNGTMGADDFACEASSVISSTDPRQAWRAFDGKNTDGREDCWHSAKKTEDPSRWFAFYSNKKLRLNSITIHNRATDMTIAIKNFEIQVLDNTSKWTTISSGKNPSNINNNTYTHYITSPTLSNYWKIKILSEYDPNYLAIGELTINADELVSVDYELNSERQCEVVSE